MEWISIVCDIPPEGAIVYAYVHRKATLLCKYVNDSFGLGDLDFDVTKWCYAFPQRVDRAPLYYKPRSNQHIEDRRAAYFSEPLQNPGR